jgi:hypothetical protein
MCGTLFDPEVARKSLHYCLVNNSGTREMDGRALFPIAVYDYVCATGDRSLMEEHWDTLKVILRKTPVDSDKDFIVRAGGNSFVDNVFNCETGGCSLSCNVLYSGAYKAMAAMGGLMNEPADTVGAWNDLGAKIAEGINRQHWRADAGYYTPGPIGSDGYEESFWENLGQSLAIWPRFGVADKARRVSVLDNKDVAFNEWGFAEREYNDRYFTRDDICFTMGHNPKRAAHGRSVWLFTEVGEVVAMGAEGRMSELKQVFFAGLRDGAFNKTFHECVHWDTGLAWRYGGQLWNAVACVAMIVQGMLGMEYGEDGMTFAHQCIPEALADMRITNLKYRDAVLTVQVNGWGTQGSVLLDGTPAEAIPADLVGEHTVTVDMSGAPATHTSLMP